MLEFKTLKLSCTEGQKGEPGRHQRLSDKCTKSLELRLSPGTEHTAIPTLANVTQHLGEGRPLAV